MPVGAPGDDRLLGELMAVGVAGGELDRSAFRPIFENGRNARHHNLHLPNSPGRGEAGRPAGNRASNKSTRQACDA